MAKKKKTPEEELLEQTIAEQTPDSAESTQAMEDEDYSAAATSLEETPMPESEAAPDDPATPEGDFDISEDAAGSGMEWEPAVPDLPPQDCEILSIEPAPIQRESADGYALDAENSSPAEPFGEEVPSPDMADAQPQDDSEITPLPEALEPDMTGPERSAANAPIPGPGDDRRAFYQLDFHELDRSLTPEEQQEWNAIYASYRGRSVLTGTVVGIDLHAIRVRDRDTGELRRQEMYCAIVIPFRVRILIPEAEMWPKGEERPGFVLRNIVGAKLDVVIIHVDREAGFAIGSRRMALNSRRYYFANRPNLNKPGTRVKCSVLAVGPRRCLVTCHGHDINLTQREMRYTAIPDLRDAYHPGDELDCIVKAYDREGERLTVSVKETRPNPFDGAELRHPVGSRRQAVIAGKYAGGVFCNLPDGAVCMCSYSYHYEDGEFAVGDKVIVIPQRYENAKKQIYGKIVAKW